MKVEPATVNLSRSLIIAPPYWAAVLFASVQLFMFSIPMFFIAPPS